MMPGHRTIFWIVAATAVIASPALLLSYGGGDSRLPTVNTIQSAYDAAKIEQPDRHDDRLVVREADCRQLEKDKFTCQVAFTDQPSTAGRLYFDIIGLDRQNPGWKLVSGLCRRTI